MQSQVGGSKFVLTEELAQEIYQHKLRLERNNIKTSGARIKGPSAAIAQLYTINAKTVRDIWNRVTWKYATCHLWTESEIIISESKSAEISEVFSTSFVALIMFIFSAKPFEGLIKLSCFAAKPGSPSARSS